MRPVARIAQSVEQGIENPRVLGSIPSPGTTILKNPPTRRVFAFGETIQLIPPFSLLTQIIEFFTLSVDSVHFPDK